MQDFLSSLADLFLSTPSARRATDKVLEIIHKYIKFLSTPSARRATRVNPYRPSSVLNFYPRPPRGGRPKTSSYTYKDKSISIHALREEGDDLSFCANSQMFTISIHALREEGDRMHSV